MEARHIQKQAENGDNGEAKENGDEKTDDAEVSKDDGNNGNNTNAKETEQPGKEAAVGPSCTLRSKFEALNLITMK